VIVDASCGEKYFVQYRYAIGQILTDNIALVACFVDMK